MRRPAKSARAPNPASIIAQVTTTTLAPTKDIASSTSPFSLVSEAILDQGGSLKTINNAGTIQASNTTLTPDTGAVVSSITNAIYLSASTAGGITVNNSGRILGNIFLGSGKDRIAFPTTRPRA